MTAGLVVGLLIGLTAGILGDAATGVGFGLAAGVVIGLAVWLTNGIESPVDLAVVVGVSDSLRRDRSNCIWRCFLLGSAIGVAAGTVVAVSTAMAAGGDDAIFAGLFLGVVAALIIGTLFGVTSGLLGAWGQWLILVRWWLPMTGRLPWRLNAFLTDAYQRGVLRQYRQVVATAWSTCAAPPSASATSPTTSPDRYSRQADSDPDYRIGVDCPTRNSDAQTQPEADLVSPFAVDFFAYPPELLPTGLSSALGCPQISVS